MPSLTVTDDIAHIWGGDVILGPTGDLGRANGVERSRQRVFRRLFTNPGDYIFHPGYGAGLPRKIGVNIDIAKIKGLILSQMKLEPSVQKIPGPAVDVRLIPGGVGVQVQVQYIALPDKQPASLTFSVDPSNG